MGIRAKFTTIFGVLATGIAVPFVTTFITAWAEQRGYLSDPEGTMNSILQSLSRVAEYSWYPWLVAFCIGLFVGLVTDWMLRRVERAERARHKSLANDLKGIARTLTTMEEGFPRGDLPSPANIDRFVDHIRAVEVSLRKIGFATPNISYEIDPLGFIERMRHFTSRVGPLLENGHIKEAKDVSRRMSAEIKNEAENARRSLPPQPAARFVDRS